MASEISQVLLQGAQLIGQTIQTQQQLFQQRQKFAQDAQMAEQTLALQQRQLELQEQNAELQRSLDQRRVKVSEQNATTAGRNAALGENQFKAEQEIRPLKEAYMRAQTAELNARAAEALSKVGGKGKDIFDIGTVGGRAAIEMLDGQIDAFIGSDPKILVDAGVAPEVVEKYRGLDRSTLEKQLGYVGKRVEAMQAMIYPGSPVSLADLEPLENERNELIKLLGVTTNLKFEALAGNTERGKTIFSASRNRLLEVTNSRTGGINDKTSALLDSMDSHFRNEGPDPISALESALSTKVDRRVAIPRLRNTFLADPSNPGNTILIATEWDAMLRPTDTLDDLKVALDELLVYAKSENPNFKPANFAAVVHTLAGMRNLNKAPPN